MKLELATDKMDPIEFKERFHSVSEHLNPQKKTL